MDKALSRVSPSAFASALVGVLTIEVSLFLKACYLRYQAKRQQALQQHSIEVEAGDDGYSVVESL